MGIGYVDQHVDEDICAMLYCSKVQLEASFWSAPVVGGRVSQIDKVSSISQLSWQELALSVAKQSLQDAAQGEYEALYWLTTEGRDWLLALGMSEWIVDAWAVEL